MKKEEKFYKFMQKELISRMDEQDAIRFVERVAIRQLKLLHAVS